MTLLVLRVCFSTPLSPLPQTLASERGVLIRHTMPSRLSLPLLETADHSANHSRNHNTC